MSVQAAAPIRKRAYYQATGVPPQVVGEYFRRLGPLVLVLDLGCGVGGVSRAAPSGVRVIGVDHDRGALELAGRFGSVAVWDAAAGRRLPFPRDRFDAVVARDLLEHLDLPWDTVQEMRAVLRPGGLALVSVPMARPRVVWNDYTHRRGFTRDAIRLLFMDAGFQIERVDRMGPLPLLARLGLIRAAPWLLRIPVLDQFWATSWEVLARKR
ncbi:MAG: class I SAM-dependent methyltransferase [Chloroflexi bacterium]|nr:class I SAM-dependent methyltransferase [Chloroflexota bacterium]MCY3957040.1 class I SAM-dependent methyltransferase [Chloroflexota bacterium]